ncbi:hypothetical protein [Novipirellula galeiformis]|uniref:hypothetical protein n=1 Tax=Novipirellula galeiformis TaxID=2528004 RepID=UPI0011B40D44|nr:hypothetical protein [Novipirellula galeiformis]
MIYKELFGTSKTKAELQNLGSEVQKLLKKRQRYVMVCFGVDLLAKERADAVLHIKKAFAKCGYANANVDVWGQSELLGLFAKYPSLCLRLRGREFDGVCSRDAWADFDDMSQTLRQSPDVAQLCEDLRDQLRSGEVRHLRLLGEPGIGKTRFALELTSADDLAPVTIFARGGDAMLKSSLFSELIQPDDHRVVLFVVDECSQADVASIWNVLKAKSERIKLVSIYHGEDRTRDDQTRRVELPRTDENEVVAILKDHGVGENEARRWAKFCDGCPRVAHAVGANLHSKSGDVLTSPSASLVWDRFLDGYEKTETDLHETRKLILRHVALFERFGFSAPVESEARFIQEMIQRTADRDVTWGKFCEAIKFWRDRKVIQGSTTLYITPRLLHVFLFKDFWKRYGNAFDIAGEMNRMPEALQRWFAEMLKHAHECEPAIDSISQLLGRKGIYPDGSFPDTESDGKLLMSLSESCPDQVLSCLRRTIGEMDSGSIATLVTVRQRIVWTLERIAVWDDHFTRAAELLLRIASVDETNFSNNAVGTFTGLFRLTPGLGATAASPKKRLRVLESALNSKSEAESDIAVKACETALSTGPNSRIIGPEHQGHRPKIRFWMPETYGELWDSYFAVWTLLNDYLSRCPSSERGKVVSAIVKGSHWMTHLPRFASKIAPTFDKLSRDNDADAKNIIAFLQFYLQRNSEKLPSGVAAQFRSLLARLDGDDFPTISKRFIRDLTWEDCHDDDGKKRLDEKLDWLASHAIENPRELEAELPWLICETSNAAFWFARRVCDNDPDRDLLPLILDAYRKQDRIESTTLLCGYLSSIGWTNLDEWEAIVLELAAERRFAEHFSEIVIHSGMTDGVVLKVIELCESGILPKVKLENWWFTDALKSISEPVFRQLIEMQIANATEGRWENSLRMCNQYYVDDLVLPESLIFELLAEPEFNDSRIGNSAGYYWTELATRFIEAYPSRKWDIFKGVLSQERRMLRCIEHHREGLMAQWMADDPSKAWECITEVLDKHEDGRWAITSWLSGAMTSSWGDSVSGPIQHLPSADIFSWVDVDRDGRSYWLCQALPKTLDKSPAGRLTRDFVARYCDDESDHNSLLSHFRSRSWCGKASENCRKLRDEAREWLKDERDRIVIGWIEDYIESLDHEIEQAEIEEERDFRYS